MAVRHICGPSVAKFLNTDREVLSIAIRGLASSISSTHFLFANHPHFSKGPYLLVENGPRGPRSSSSLLFVCPVRYQYTATHQNHHEHAPSVGPTIVNDLRESATTQTGQPAQRDKLDLTFNDTKNAYKSKRTSELVRAYIVLKLSSYDILVKNHKKVSSNKNYATKLLLFNLLIIFFFSHFNL